MSPEPALFAYDSTFIKLASEKVVLAKGYYCIVQGREKLRL